MSNNNEMYHLGVFGDEEDMIKAARELRNNNIKIDDFFTPFPVHGIDELLEIKRSVIPYICFGGGALGLLIAAALQIWTSVFAWPLNVGGKPYNSLPAFIPIGFELTVLFGALITVGGFFAITGLFPGKEKNRIHLKATEDAFVLSVKEDTGLDVEKVKSVFDSNGASEILSKGGNEWI